MCPILSLVTISIERDISFIECQIDISCNEIALLPIHHTDHTTPKKLTTIYQWVFTEVLIHIYVYNLDNWWRKI